MAYDAMRGQPIPDVADPPASPTAAAAAMGAAGLPSAQQAPGSGERPPPLDVAEVQALLSRFKVPPPCWLPPFQRGKGPFYGARKPEVDMGPGCCTRGSDLQGNSVQQDPNAGADGTFTLTGLEPSPAFCSFRTDTCAPVHHRRPTRSWRTLRRPRRPSTSRTLSERGAAAPGSSSAARGNTSPRPTCRCGLNPKPQCAHYAHQPD